MVRKSVFFSFVFLLILCLVGFVSALSIPSGGVAYYNFSGTSDLWFNNDVTNSGAVSSSNYPSFAVSGDSSPSSFDFEAGDNDYAVANSTILGVGDKTISLWMRVESLANWRSVVGTGKGLTASMDGFFLYLSADGSGKFSVGTGSGLHYDVNFPASTVSAGKWYHVVLLQNSTGAYVLLNTSVVASDTTSTGTEAAGSYNFTISGQGNSPTSYGFDGLIDNIQLFNRSLNASEIYTLFNYGFLVNETVPMVGNHSESAFISSQTGTTSLSVSGTNYTILTESFEDNESEQLYGDITVQMFSPTNTVVMCHVLANGTSIANGSRTNLAGTIGSLALSTPVVNTSVGTNTLELVCSKQGTSTLTIGLTKGIGHVSTNNVTYYSDVISNSSVTLNNESLLNETFTAPYDGIAVVEWVNQISNNDVSSQHVITQIVTNLGVCGVFNRTMNSGASASTGGGCSFNVTEGTNITGGLYVIGSNINISHSIKFKFLTSPVNYVNIHPTSVGTSPTLLETFLINNSVDFDKLFLRSGISVSDSSQTFNLFFSVNGTNTTVIPKTASSNAEVLISQDLVSVPAQILNVSLYGYSSAGTVDINGGDFLAYVVQDFPTNGSFFEIRAYDAWDNSTLTNFSAYVGGVNVSTTDGVLEIFTLDSLVNVVVYADGYFSESYLSHNSSNSLSAYLVSPKMNRVIFSNYTEYLGTNYTGSLSFSVEAACLGSQTLYILADGVVEDSYSLTCNGNKANNSDIFISSSEGSMNISFNWSYDSSYLVGQDFTFDLYSPKIEQNFAITGGFNDNSTAGWVYCYDNVSPIINYSLYWNGGLFLDTNLSNATNQSFSNESRLGINFIYSECSDVVGRSVTKNTSKSINSGNFFLTDERIGGLFDVTNLSSVIVYVDDNSTSLDLKALGGAGNFTFTSEGNEILRFEFVYSDGFVLNRYIDVSLLTENDNAICAVKDEGLTFYEQIIISSSDSTPVRMKAVYADCLVINDRTRFAYQTSFAIRTFTIDTSYELFDYQNDVFSLLASVDGGLEQYINIDALVFASESSTIDIGVETLAIESYSNTSIRFFYNNTQGDNSALSFIIKRLDTGTNVYSSGDLGAINSLNFIYDWSSLAGVTDETLFQVVLTSVKEDDSVNVMKRYFNTSGRTGRMNPKLIFSVVFLMLLFGFSFTTANAALSWFGVIITIVNFGLLAMTVWTESLLWLAGINGIVLIYVIVVMQYQTNKELVT